METNRREELASSISRNVGQEPIRRGVVIAFIDSLAEAIVASDNSNTMLTHLQEALEVAVQSTPSLREQSLRQLRGLHAVLRAAVEIRLRGLGS